MKPRHIVLISGPSGCGKSTLIRQLAASTLAPEILARLPEQSGSWPVVEANDVLKGTLSTQALRRDKNPADGWLVHYDKSQSAVGWARPSSVAPGACLFLRQTDPPDPAG